MFNWVKKLTGVSELQEQLNAVIEEKNKQIAEAENKLAEIEKASQAKEIATARGEPYVRVVEVELQEDNPGNGYFELDWNEHFVRKLIESGYTGDTQEEIVDQWFTELCRNISAQEM